MQENPESDAVLSESDMEIVDALQVGPRATWTQLAGALGVSASTVQRRWTRLQRSGEAWVSVAFGPRQYGRIVFALVELECDPARVLEAAQALAEMPPVISVAVTTGEYDISAIVLAENLTAISGLLLRDIPGVVGVRRLRSDIGTEWFGGTRWRLGAVEPGRLRALRDAERAESPAVSRMDRRDGALFALLSMDGRMSYAELGRRLGESELAVKRRLHLLQRGHDIVFRCDVARRLVGSQTVVMIRMAVPERDLHRVGATLRNWPECRLCASVVGTENIVFAAALNSVSHLTRLVAKIEHELPTARVTERNVTIRTVKVYGRLLDGSSRCVRTVPIDIWQGPDPLG